MLPPDATLASLLQSATTSPVLFWVNYWDVFIDYVDKVNKMPEEHGHLYAGRALFMLK